MQTYNQAPRFKTTPTGQLAHKLILMWRRCQPSFLGTVSELDNSPLLTLNVYKVQAYSLVWEHAEADHPSTNQDDSL